MDKPTPKQLEAGYRSWPPPSWYSTRSSRRILAGMGAASAGMIWISAIVCFYLAPSNTAMWTTFALAGIASVIYVVFYSALIGATRGTVGLADRYLDERQSRERQKIQADARRGTLWILIALGVSLSLAMPRGEPIVRVPSAAVIVLVLAMITTHLILPSLLAAWRLPDPLPDDED